MTWPEYDDRYNAREIALVEYLEARLDAELFWVTRDPSATSSTGEKPFNIVVRFLGFGPPKNPTVGKKTDGLEFGLLCIPLATTDQEASQAINFMLDTVTAIFREPGIAGGAFACFGNTLGRPISWSIDRGIKGENDEADLTGELQLTVDIVEDNYDPPAGLMKDILAWTEREGTTAEAEIQGLEAGEFAWIHAGGKTETAAISRTGGSDTRILLRVYDEADLAKIGRITLDIRGPEAYTDPLAIRAGAELGAMATAWRLVTPARTNPVMTGASSPSGTASASSIIGGGYEAWRAFNGGIATGSGDWVATAGVFPSWLQYQFATATLIKSYRITTRGEPGYPLAPKSWTLAGSNDGSTWTTLDTQSNITSWATTVMRTLTFGLPNNTTAYAYYRLTITAGNQNYAAVGELELCADLPIVANPTRTLYLENTGSYAIGIDSITGPDWLEISGAPASIAAGETESFTATAVETTPGIYTGAITVTTADGTEIEIPVQATIYAPA